MRSRCTELDAGSCNLEREHVALRQQLLHSEQVKRKAGNKVWRTSDNYPYSRQRPCFFLPHYALLVVLICIVCKRVEVLASCNSALEASPACLTCSRISYAVSQLIRATPIGLRIPTYLSISTRRLTPYCFDYPRRSFLDSFTCTVAEITPPALPLLTAQVSHLS